MESIYTLAFGIAIFLFALLYFRRKHLERRPLPPSPPADYFIGHLRTVATAKNPELIFHKWAQQYGDIYHTKMLGQTVIMLNSVRAAVDLLEKRGLNYTSRPRCVVYELYAHGHSDDAVDGLTSGSLQSGLGLKHVFMPSGDRFKKQRKFYQHHFNGAKSRSYQPIQQDEAQNLIKNLLEDPGDYDQYLRR
ncbi:cytochrome P450 [Infundibulicybe gibba]|nr:cytochrome P450 [Infundibulicybe gibba]